MATKKLATELLDNYYQALIFSLPMKSTEFLNKLHQSGLIIEELKHNLESLTARKEKASYFLDHVIRPAVANGDNTNFIKLLTIMKNCNHDNANDLAEQIETEYAMDIKSSKSAVKHSITSLDEVKNSEKYLNSSPLLKDLSNLVTPRYATKWKDIGLKMGLMKSQLDIIEHDHGRSVVKCCNEMWGHWLDTKTTVTWKDVLNSLEHKAVIEEEQNDNFQKVDINQLMNTLPLLQEKWQLVGINLGVPMDKLDWIFREAEKGNTHPDSFNTFCCIQMLSYWFHNSDNISADYIIAKISAPHVGVNDKITKIRDILTSNQFSTGNSVLRKYALNPPEGSEAQYVEMKTNICKELNEFHCSIDDVLLFLENSDVDPEVLKSISSFPNLFKSLEKHGLMKKGDISWLKAILKYIKCAEALAILENYGALLIGDKTICSHVNSSKISNGFVVKLLHNSLENSTINDCCHAKSTMSKVIGLKETDGILDSAEVGSLTFYWKVKRNIKITIPKFIGASLMKNCKDAGITHIGTITNGDVRLVDITELEIDEVTGNS